MAFVLPLIGPIVSKGLDIIDKLVPDKAEANRLKAAYAMEAMKQDYSAEIAQMQSINSTMQAEAKSEHWAQWLWRPTVGFTFAAILVNNFILLPYFAHLGVVPLPIPDAVWTAMLVVLGASAATRGWEKVTKAQVGGVQPQPPSITVTSPPPDPSPPQA